MVGLSFIHTICNNASDIRTYTYVGYDARVCTRCAPYIHKRFLKVARRSRAHVIAYDAKSTGTRRGAHNDDKFEFGRVLRARLSETKQTENHIPNEFCVVLCFVIVAKVVEREHEQEQSDGMKICYSIYKQHICMTGNYIRKTHDRAAPNQTIPGGIGRAVMMAMMKMRFLHTLICCDSTADACNPFGNTSFHD